MRELEVVWIFGLVFIFYDELLGRIVWVFCFFGCFFLFFGEVFCYFKFGGKLALSVFRIVNNRLYDFYGWFMKLIKLVLIFYFADAEGNF